MKLLYFIAQRGLTNSIADKATDDYVPVLNEMLRAHAEHPEDREGDLVHADLEEAKRMAFDLLFDLGDKRIDLLCIAIDDALFIELEAAGDVRDSVRKDAFGGRLLKISQHGCQVINGRCEVQPLHFLVSTAADMSAPYAVN